MTALKGRDIPVQGNALGNGPKTTSPEGAAYSHGRGRLPVRCNPLSLVVGCLRLSSSAGDASAKARLHRWGDAVPASRSDGAWYCGADIPVCPRIRAQTGMSVPLWAAFVDGIDTVATCRYLAISLGSTGRIGSTAVPGSRTRKSEAPPITNLQSHISNLKLPLAFLMPWQLPLLRGPGPAVESASRSAHSKPLAHVVRHAGWPNGPFCISTAPLPGIRGVVAAWSPRISPLLLHSSIIRPSRMINQRDRGKHRRLGGSSPVCGSVRRQPNLRTLELPNFRTSFAIFACFAVILQIPLALLASWRFNTSRVVRCRRQPNFRTP